MDETFPMGEVVVDDVHLDGGGLGLNGDNDTYLLKSVYSFCKRCLQFVIINNRDLNGWL